MDSNLSIYNTLTRKKEKFEPYNPPFAGIYVCGPTVYSEPHLGHARVNIVFDILFRYLLHLGYRVRYVRNITDVGHLENEDTDSGEDKIARKARQEHIEPMEVVQRYMNNFHKNMGILNVLDPSIEPRATGHIIEQQEMIRQLIEKGFAYESKGSVYFDVEKYNSKYNYGILSGRVLEDLVSNTRKLDGQEEKRNSFDFALWKKASPEHIMKWPSLWSDGFPGWHMECSAMSLKYLGQPFDIHGGGMDLMFPHHECEIAQSTAILGQQPVKYWMHNNMITINGQKMARSLNNFITLEQLFTGSHPALEQAYSPMTVKFFILQAHYRSTLDFSNEALKASEKGLARLMTAIDTLEQLQPSAKSTVDVDGLVKKCYAALDDDLNTPVMISCLFDGVKYINSIAGGKETITTGDLDMLKKLYNDLVFEVLGLKITEKGESADDDADGLMNIILELRTKAKLDKDWGTSDMIRDALSGLGIEVKDTKEGVVWEKKR